MKEWKERTHAFRVSIKDGERGLVIYRYNRYGVKPHAYTPSLGLFMRLFIALQVWERKDLGNEVIYINPAFNRDVQLEYKV